MKITLVFKVNKKDPKAASMVYSKKTVQHRMLSVNPLTSNMPFIGNPVNKFALKNN